MRKILHVAVLSILLINLSCTKPTTNTQSLEIESIEKDTTVIEPEDNGPKYATTLEWQIKEDEDNNDKQSELQLGYSLAESYQVLHDSLSSAKDVPYKEFLASKFPRKDTVCRNKNNNIEVIYYNSTNDSNDSNYYITTTVYKHYREYLSLVEDDKGTIIHRSLLEFGEIDPETVSDREWTEPLGESDIGYYSHILLPSTPKKSYELLYQLLEDQNSEDGIQMQPTLPTKDTIYSSLHEFYGHVTTEYKLENEKIEIEIGYEGGVTTYILEEYNYNTTKVTRVLSPD